MSFKGVKLTGEREMKEIVMSTQPVVYSRVALRHNFPIKKKLSLLSVLSRNWTGTCGVYGGLEIHYSILVRMLYYLLFRCCTILHVLLRYIECSVIRPLIVASSHGRGAYSFLYMEVVKDSGEWCLN